ncbi:hypothetical protein H0I39_13530 [Ottowia beijingensis]|uniref:Uncharacterized protein n=1 Tax=Ottowia beijingensis TaxID=1207057 RepID=A0A853IW12_9BURK|nr:hypothetical protein [Ottowia beijingensis]NZA02524.1 hypothetical protein [Ottowia beijingensis]
MSKVFWASLRGDDAVNHSKEMPVRVSSLNESTKRSGMLEVGIASNLSAVVNPWPAPVVPHAVFGETVPLVEMELDAT